MTLGIDVIERALTDLLTGGFGEPRTLRDVRRAYGGKDVAALIAREELGLPAPGEGRLPRLGEAPAPAWWRAAHPHSRTNDLRRAYESEKKRLERYWPGPGAQRRRAGASEVRELAARARAKVSAGPIAQVRADGLKIRVHARIKVSDKEWDQWLPGQSHAKSAGGGPNLWTLTGGLVRGVVGLWAMGEVEDSAEELLSTFIEDYWGSGQPVEIIELYACDLRHV